MRVLFGHQNLPQLLYRNNTHVLNETYIRYRTLEKVSFEESHHSFYLHLAMIANKRHRAFREPVKNKISSCFTTSFL